MQSTTNYGIFKTIAGNRRIDPNHVVRLAKAIEKKDLLSEYPILVNEKMELIDGQHRLVAASSINVPVYYTVVRGLDLENVMDVNTASKSWKLNDFVESFISVGNIDYMELKEFAAKYHVGYGMAASLLGGRSVVVGGSGVRRIRSGEFTVNARVMAERVARLLVELENYSDFKATADRALANALWYALLNEDFNSDRLLSKVKTHGLRLVKRVNTRYYLIQLEEIYNFSAKHVVTLYTGQA